MSEYVIALDAMGGDQAPDAIVAGAVAALRRFGDIRVLLAGPEEQLRGLLADAEDVMDRLGFLPADDVIQMDESPMLAVRKKVNSSMVQAMLAVREGRAGAVVSAGNTGAVLAGGMLRIGRIPGIERPALAPVIPGAKKPFLLIDAGANVDCQPRYLEQFGLMGSVYMRSVMGVQRPAVGLVNIGTEAEKGNKLTKETYQLMQAGADVVALVEGAPSIGGYGVHAGKIRRAGVPIFLGHTVKEVRGTDKVEKAVIAAVDPKWQIIPGSEKTFDVDTVCLAVGLNPMTELVWMTGCSFVFIPAFGGHVPMHDENMETTIKGLYVAGDITGVEEASSAMEEGNLAGVAAAEALGCFDAHEAEKRKSEIRGRLEVLRSGMFGEKRRTAKQVQLDSMKA